MLDSKMSLILENQTWSLAGLMVFGLMLGLLAENFRQRSKRRQSELLAPKRTGLRQMAQAVAADSNAEEEWTVRRIEPKIHAEELQNADESSHSSASMRGYERQASQHYPPKNSKSSYASAPRIQTQAATPSSKNDSLPPAMTPILNQDPALLMSFILAGSQKFQGYDLLQTILDCNLRYGQKGYFHRYESDEGQGAILFSLAAIENDGTFDLDAMGSVESKGLCLFMRLQKTGNQPRLNMMLEVGHQLAEELAVQLLDQHRRPLNRHSFIEYVQQIRLYEKNSHLHQDEIVDR